MRRIALILTGLAIWGAAAVVAVQTTKVPSEGAHDIGWVFIVAASTLGMLGCWPLVLAMRERPKKK